LIHGAPGTGQQRALRGNDRLFLAGRETGWIVESGSLAVFAVELEDGRPLAQPRHLFSVGPGEVLLGVEPGSRGMMAVPVETTCVREILARELSVYELEPWIRKLGSVFSSMRPPRAPAEAAGLLEPGAVIASNGNEVTWLRLLNGYVRLMGYDEGRVEVPGTIFPLAPGMWCVAGSLCEVDLAPLDRANMSLVEAVLFRAIDDLQHQQEVALRNQFEQRLDLNRHVTAEAMLELASVSGGRPKALLPTTALSPMLAAVEAVGRAQGITVCSPPADERDRGALESIAQASGFRTRRVLLSGRWWEQQAGPILAYRADSQSPVALIPVRRPVLHRNGYDLFDPANTTPTPVTPRVAADIAPVAFTFYRPLGQEAGISDMLRFGIEFCRRDLAVTLFSGLMAAILGMAVPQGTALLVGQAIPDANHGLLVQIALGMAAAIIAAMLFELAQSIALLRLHSGATIALQTALWDRLLKMSPGFFRRFSTGDLRTRVEAISRIHQTLTLDFLRLILLGLAGCLNLGLMFYYQASLGAIALASGAAVILAVAFAGSVLTRLEAVQQDLDGRLNGLMVQMINAVGKLRVAGAEQRAFAHWGKLYTRKQQIALRIRLNRDRVRVINVMLPILTSTAAFWFVLGRTGASVVPLGTFLAYNAALGTFMAGLTGMSDALGALMSIPNLWNRMRPILDARPEVEPGKTHPGKLAGRVVFDRVSFRYREDGPATLIDISIRAEPGDCIALVGPSGSGKSTILNLLLRFELPKSGAIYLDGQALASLDIAAVRRQLGVVSQDSRLIAQSILENIICGGLNTMDEAWEAARQAGLAEDIANMPMGMHTVISEGGSNISGGQRQRLLIARALVRKPSVLIFDEATSALDNRTQAIVTESLERLKTTRIVVAHRLSTIRHADRIYVIDGGQVVQQGTYDELARQPGLFVQLMKRQLA
jgi:NHLM bacteriocin system ABC transporter ATP-binding protein